MRRAVFLLGLAVLLALRAGGASAYTPGAGTLWSDNFQDGDDKGWAVVGALSKFSVADRGGSKVYLADTQPDLFRGLPETSGRPFVAVPVGTIDLCFELNAVGGAGFEFRADLRPPRDDGDFFRLVVAADGHAEIRLITTTGSTTLCSSAPSLVATGAPTWLRMRLRPGAGSATNASLRAWSGGATAEPGAGWDAQGATPGTESIPYLQRLAFTAVQPSGETFVDDIDVFGDDSAGVLSTIKTVWIVEASHLDIGFTAPPDEIETFAKTHLDQVVANLRSTPGYRWTIENSWQLYRWMERSSPAEIQELFDFARAGRISLSAGYVNLHSTVTSREEMIRALSFSRAIARQEGLPVRTYIHDDVPGATWALPELLAKSGVSFYLGGMNCFIGGAVTHPSHAERPFWWEGPDGSRVLSWTTFDSYAEGISIYGLSFFDRLANLHAGLGAGLGEQEGLGYPHQNLLIMRVFDNHYQGLFVKNLVDQWNATYSTPRLRLASPEEFFDAVQAEIATSGWSIPTFRGDSGSAWTATIPGTAHTQEDASEARRQLEAAETFTAAASVLGAGHPTAAIDLAWRRILEVDEHSGGGAPWPGLLTPEETNRQSLIHQGYASEARSNAESALSGSLAALSARVELPGGGIVVWNAQDQQRSAPVRAELPAGWTRGAFRLIDASRGAEVPYQSDPASATGILFVAADVPARGWRGYRLLRGAPSPSGAGTLVVTPTTIENGFYRVTVDPVDGSVVSLVELSTARELIDGAAGYRFGQSASNTNSGVFWGVAPAADAPVSAAVSMGASGPVMASLLVTREGTPAASMEIRLFEGLDRVEFANVFDRQRCAFVPRADGSRAWALTFPFSLTDFTFGTESPARLLRPASDGFDRSSTFAALNSLACVDAEDVAGGLVLASPEAPVSEWGGISTGLPAHRTARATWMLRVKTVADEALWADNTTGPLDDEPGTSSLHPATLLLRARPLGLSEAAVRRMGEDLVDPLHAVAVSAGVGELPAGGRALFSLTDADARLVTVKRSLDGASIVARVEDQEGVARDLALRSSVLGLASPTSAGLVDEQPIVALAMAGEDVLVPVTPFGTTTISATPSSPKPPTLLFVRKNAAADGVDLDWQDGSPRFRVLRSLRRDLSGDSVIAADDLPTRTFTDPSVLNDRVTYFYDVE